MLKTFSRSTAVLFCLLFLFKAGIAQQIENLTFRLERTEIIINYDLLGDTDKTYFITAFASHNNFTNALQFVTGDVGEDVVPGNNKTITMDAVRELGNYRGNLQVRLRARYIPLVVFENIDKVRRGKSHEIKWGSNTSQDNIRFELYRGNERVRNLGPVPNIGNWNWAVPRKQKPGKGFRIKAISLNKSTFTADFRISPKIPLIIKILPILGGVGGFFIIMEQLKDDGPTPPTPIPLPKLPD